MSDAEKKLHIDEGWKEQVEREKEAAKQAAAQLPSGADRPAAESLDSAEESVRRHAAQSTGEEQPFGEPAGNPGDSGTRDRPLPAPSLAFLVTTIATQAMVALGEVPNPLTGKLEKLPNQARHFIDTLAMLELKTEGNRTPEESALLRSVLHQLRTAFVASL